MPGVGAIVSPQAAAWRGVVCLNMMAAAVWVTTQHRDPSNQSLSSLPKASAPVSLPASLVHSVSLTPAFASDLLPVADSFSC